MTVTKRKAKPITAHPLFPIVTSLWFAAFLSLGSFAVAPQLLEGPVVALGIPKILPAAQPPLGFTVRALLAMVMLGVGGLAGYFIGKALAGGKSESPVRARSFGRTADKAVAPAPQSLAEAEPVSGRRASHRRPLNPLEDLGEPVGVPFSGETYAPVDPQALDGADFITQAAETARLPWEHELESEDAETTPLALQPASSQHQAQLDDPLALDLLFADAEVISKGIEPAYDVSVSEAPISSAPVFHTSAPDQQDVDQAELQDHAQFAQAEAIASSSAEEVLDNQAMPEADLPVSQPVQANVPFGVPLIKTPLFQAPTLAPTPLSRSPLEELGLVQLTERLALAIGRRHARADSAPHAYAPAEAAPEPAPVQAFSGQAVTQENEPSYGDFEVVQPQSSAAIPRFGMVEAAPDDAIDEAAAEPASYDERVVQLRPAALRPFMPEPEASEGEAPEFERFLRVRDPETVVTSPAADFDAEDLDEEPVDEDDEEIVWEPSGAEADVAEERYPSLLDMGAGSLRQRAQNATSAFVIDSGDETEAEEQDGFEPAVVFPGEEPPFATPFETTPRLFERPAGSLPASARAASGAGLSDMIIPMAGSPLAAPGRAAPSSPIDALGNPTEVQAVQNDAPSGAAIDAEEADRALRAALATLQRMTAQG